MKIIISHSKNKRQIEALSARTIWPIPGANEDSYRLNGNSQQSNSLGAIARREALAEGRPSGQLSPRWVEWLMGYPDEWPALEASGMPLSPRSPKKSAGGSSRGKK